MEDNVHCSGNHLGQLIKRGLLFKNLLKATPTQTYSITVVGQIHCPLDKI